MNKKEGISRIGTFVSALAWIAAAVIVIFSIYLTFSSYRPDWSALLIGTLISAGAWGLLQGVVWVIDGFLGNKGDQSSILWPRRFRFRKGRQRSAYGSRQDLVGPHGWLFFLIISLMIFTPLMLLGGTLGDIGDAERLNPSLRSLPAWGNYKIAAWCLVAAAASLKIAAGYRLKTIHTPNSALFAVTVLWVAGPVVDMSSLMLLHTMLKIPLNLILSAEVVNAFLGSVAYAVFWTAYLKWSRRVRNTYFSRSGSVGQESFEAR